MTEAVNRAPPQHGWSVLPIPVLIALTVILHVTVPSAAFYDPPWLVLIGNTLFVTVVAIVVAVIAWRNYCSAGRIQVLLLGCGVLIFGAGGVLAAAVRGLPDGANLNVTIYNVGALLGAAFHFIAAFILLAGVAAEAAVGRRKLWLSIGYGGSLLFMALLTTDTVRGLIPPFFIQGVGPTALRQQVLGAAAVLFVFSFVVFIAAYLRNRERFLYWYACALGLTAVSLTAFFIQRSVGSPVGWVGRFSQYLGGIYFLVSLLTARRSAEHRGSSLDDVLTASLTGAEQRFHLVLENMSEGLMLFDAQQNLVYQNPASLRIHGFDPSDKGQIGRERLPATWNAWDEDERPITFEEWPVSRVFRGERFQNQLLHVMHVESGYEFDGSYNGAPIVGEDGKLKFGFITIRDVTEQREAQLALSESFRQLEAANKELETFTYSVSHDLRGPLRSITGFAHILEDEHRAEMSADAQHCVEMIHGNAEQMGELIEDLLAFSRLSQQPLVRHTVSATSLAHDALHQLEPELAGRPIAISVDELPDMHADPHLLKQVWVNLLANAIKFTRGRDPAVIHVGHESVDGVPAYFVRDNGAGFDMRYAAKLFRIFQRLHREEEFEGTGVGLAIVHRIVSRHGGRVWAEAAKNEGATFYFTLGKMPEHG